jgi:hypothetical protein
MADDKLAMTPNANNALTSRPDFIPQSHEGLDHLTKEDIQIPRLVIAQQMSPEIEEGNAKFIPELRAGIIFNSLTQRMYGKGPLDFAVVRADKPRWVEFAPRDAGGGVVDPEVKDGDPRTKFWTDDEGKRRNPIATKFYDFILVLDPEGVQELVALSLKSTGLTVARSLNGLMQMRNAPIYSGIYTATSKSKKNPKGTFHQFDLRPNGWPKSQATFDFLKETYETLRVEEVKIHTETTLADTIDENDDFDFGANATSEASNSEM